MQNGHTDQRKWRTIRFCREFAVVTSYLSWPLISWTQPRTQFTKLLGVQSFSASHPRELPRFTNRCPPAPAAQNLICLSGAVCTLGLTIVGIHAHVQKNIMSDPECVPAEVGRPKSKTATSMGMRESAKYLAASPYIRNLAMLVIAYGACVRCADKTRTQQQRKTLPPP